MNRRILVFVVVVILGSQGFTHAMDAREILQRVAEQTFGETLRVALAIKTSKGGKTISEHSVWLIGKSSKDGASFFIDFEEPKDARGLRFLFEMRPEKEPRAFVHLPATGKTTPVAVDDPSADIGGTGLTMEEVRGFLPRLDDSATIIKEEKIGNRDCWVIRVGKQDGKSEHSLWITKDSFLVMKSESAPAANGKAKRTFRVVEVFKTERDKEFPRVEEVLIPDKGLKIEVRQLHGVFGVELPDELFDPDTFGTFKWRD